MNRILMTMNPSEWRLLIEAVIVTATITMAGSFALYKFVLARRKEPDAYANLLDNLDKMAKQILELQVDMLELKMGVRILIAQVIRLGETPEWTPPSAERQSAQGNGRPVHVIISALFNNEEIDDLAARCDIDPEQLEGRTRTRRAQSLVDAAARLGKSSELIAMARQLRPEGKI